MSFPHKEQNTTTSCHHPPCVDSLMLKALSRSASDKDSDMNTETGGTSTAQEHDLKEGPTALCGLADVEGFVQKCLRQGQ